MSKFIPKPIISVGFSTKSKTSGKLSIEIDGNKTKSLNIEQYNELLYQLNEVKISITNLRKNAETKHAQQLFGINNSPKTVEKIPEIKNKLLTITKEDLSVIKILLKEERILQAVKYYKDITGTGLYEAKKYIDSLR